MTASANSPTIGELCAAFAAGTIKRDAFWQAMRARHLDLRCYHDLIKTGRAAVIEITESDIVLGLENGLKFIWQPEQVREPPSEVVNRGDYEPYELAMLTACAAGSLHAVDIGANIGWYAMHLALAMAPEGRVSAFEPVPATAAVLARNITLNGLDDRITLRRVGLAETAGSAEIFIPEFSGHVAASLRNLHRDEESETVTVELSTLNAEIGADKVDLIKCDVEGIELMVLKGGETVIGRNRPVLFLEMLRKWSAAFDYHPNDIVGWAAALGYGCWGIAQDVLERIDAVDEDTRPTNFLFLQPDRHGDLMARLHAR